MLAANDVYAKSVVDCVLDLVYVVDSSGSIGQRNWMITLQFLTSVTRLFDIGPDHVRVSFVLFSTDATVEWGLTRYQDRSSLTSAIGNVRYLGFRTNLNEALYLTRTQVFASARPNALKAAIILTDGVDNVPTTRTQLTIQNATECKRQGIRLVTVGVTNQVDVQRLRQIASDPDRHVFRVDDFSDLMNINTRLRPVVCGGTLSNLIKYQISFYTSN